MPTRHALRPTARLAAQTALLLGLAAGLLPHSQAAAPGCVDVEVHNVRPKEGLVMVAVYADEATFRKQTLKSLRLPAGEQSVQRFELCELGLAAGASVSLVLFQDLNSDGKLNANFMGIPNEPWGASGTPGLMGPQWATTAVPLNGSAIVVKLSQ